MKERTWPYCVVPDPDAPVLWNVRRPDGGAVFRNGVEYWTATDACAALNDRWDEIDGPR